jgi:hypothetical protein
MSKPKFRVLQREFREEIDHSYPLDGISSGLDTTLVDRLGSPPATVLCSISFHFISFHLISLHFAYFLGWHVRLHDVRQYL